MHRHAAIHDSPKSQASEHIYPEECGIGIGLRTDGEGYTYIASLQPGGPAHRSGLVDVGDVLCQVNGLSVLNRSGDEVASMIVGREGTTVQLGLEPRASLTDSLKIVRLRREFSSWDEPSSHASVAQSQHRSQRSYQSSYSPPESNINPPYSQMYHSILPQQKQPPTGGYNHPISRSLDNGFALPAAAASYDHPIARTLPIDNNLAMTVGTNKPSRSKGRLSYRMLESRTKAAADGRADNFVEVLEAHGIRTHNIDDEEYSHIHQQQLQQQLQQQQQQRSSNVTFAAEPILLASPDRKFSPPWHNSTNNNTNNSNNHSPPTTTHVQTSPITALTTSVKAAQTSPPQQPPYARASVLLPSSLLASSSPKIYIIYYSLYHHVSKLAKYIARGVQKAGGIPSMFQVAETLTPEVLHKMHAPPKEDIPVILPHQLLEADGIIFGIPTRFGMVCAQMKALFDSTGQIWAKGELIGKPVSVFFATGTQCGGQETTALSVLPFIAHHGMIYVPIGYPSSSMDETDEINGCSPYGAGTIAGPDGSRTPSHAELTIAEYQGSYFTKIVNKLIKK